MKSRRSLLFCTTMTSLVASSALVGLAAPATGAEPVKSPPTSSRSAATNGAIEAKMLDQVILEEAANKIAKTATSQGDRGFTDVSINPNYGSVQVLWKKDRSIPADVQRIIDAYVAAGTSIATSTAAYSSDELDQAGTDLLASEAQAGVPTSQRAVQVWSADDGSGLEIATMGTDAANADVQELREDFPIVTTETGGAATPLIGRLDDTPRYWGGSRIVMLENSQATSGQGCTSAFAVAQGSGENLLSAAHCGGPGTLVVTQTGRKVGVVSGTRPAVAGSDTSIIDADIVSGTGASPAIYTGPYNSTSGNWVVGKVNDVKGSLVCSSGSFSGARCDIEVSRANVKYSPSPGVTYTNVTIGKQRNNANAAGSGDSGGPIFSLAKNAPTRVMARGVISFGLNASKVACTGVINNSNGTKRACFSEIAWIPIDTALANHGATLMMYQG